MFFKTLQIILGTATFIFIATAILNFVGVELEIYINYLVWFIVLILFYCILPKKTGNFFNNNNI